MITPSGPRCDVCGSYILPVDPDERVNAFSVAITETVLHCHNRCKTAILEAGEDWHNLPSGPLREAYAEAARLGIIP